MFWIIGILAATCCWAQLSSSTGADVVAAQRAKAIFTEHLGVLLEARCLICHNSQLKQSGLDLSTRDLLLRGGDRGLAIVPGNPEESLLYKAVAHKQEPFMPHKSPRFPDEIVAQFADWIRGGVPYERELKPGGTIAKPEQNAPAHWAYQVPKRPVVPTPKDRSWVLNPVDAFIAIEREKQGLTPATPADPRVLLRRLYLDLIGLPPTPAEISAFLADRAPDAYEKVVERLLASPGYGERWGRHWMDIWRYSDWYGFRQTNQVRNGARHLWRWRDWIIESINADKGYDRMIQEMLAGDELAPGDPNTLRATGYLARNWYRFSRNVWLQDTVEHAASGFLGITLKCARCHDHKYDPIAQTEYYRMRAFFEPHDVRTDRVPGQADLEKDGLPRVFDGVPRESLNDEPYFPALYAETFLFVRGDEKHPEGQPLAPGTPAVLRGESLKITPVKLDFETRYPDFRPFVHHDLIEQAKGEIEKAESALAKAREELAAAQRELTNPSPPTTTTGGDEAGESPKKKLDPQERLKKAQAGVPAAEKHLDTVRAMLPALEARIAADTARYADPPKPDAEALAEAARKAEGVANLARADESLLLVNQAFEETKAAGNPISKEAQKKLEAVRKQLKEAQDALAARAEYTPVGTLYPETSTGRRTALAQWITDRGNPLTARVAVNHIWLRHFGKALVPTVSNFGMNGKPPTHPELLDWLAVELMDRNWSMKAIHRLIVTSNTYRMRSSVMEGKSNLVKDPDNRYYWRMPFRRMEAEVIRDSILHLSGKLDTTMGGPEVDHKLGQTNFRRSVYFQHTPDVVVDFLKVFDPADTGESYQRTESVVPQQALALANSDLSFSQARILARALGEQAGQGANAKFIKAAFEQVLGRPPTSEETAKAMQFLDRQSVRLQDTTKLTAYAGGDAQTPPANEGWLRAREDFVHVLVNHNEFVTIR